jgi:Kdo2-lipid IVA lauroyltransferase/acyltransferase
MSALIDQDTRVAGIPVPFFGRKAATPSALISLGQRYRAIFVSVFIVRTGLRHYEIFAKEFDPGLSIEELLTQYNARLEGYVRAYPSQWVWMHKRWRTTENGKRLSSREYLRMLSGEALAPLRTRLL